MSSGEGRNPWLYNLFKETRKLERETDLRLKEFIDKFQNQEVTRHSGKSFDEVMGDFSRVVDGILIRIGVFFGVGIFVSGAALVYGLYAVLSKPGGSSSSSGGNNNKGKGGGSSGNNKGEGEGGSSCCSGNNKGKGGGSSWIKPWHNYCIYCGCPINKGGVGGNKKKDDH